MNSEISTTSDDAPAQPDPKRCPLCGGDDLRIKFPDSPKPITYCLDCLMGTAPGMAAVDMMLFQTCIDQRNRKRATDASAMRT
jgi:hypothetical protein